MSCDTKASCTDCQGHAASVVPSASPFPTDTMPDELNEPERSVQPLSSFVPTTCASDTDEGDYETSSEGMVLSKRSGTGIHKAQAKDPFYVYFEEKRASLSKYAAFDGDVFAIKSEVISDLPHEIMESRLTQKITYVRDGLILISERSKSLPSLKSKSVSAGFTSADVASLSARKRKMSMIIKRMAPFISPYPSTVSLTTGATTNLRGRRYEKRRLASGAILPSLSDTTVINDGRRSEEHVTEVTPHDMKNNRRAMNWDPRRDGIRTFVNDEGAINVTNNDDDLADVARNPYSSIKSVYLPSHLSDPLALPHDSGKSKKVSTDVETLLKIDHELGPLQCQYSEIIGKARALGLIGTGFDTGYLDIFCHVNRPDAFVQFAPSPSVSDYFPDRGQTYLRPATISSGGIENRSVLVDKIPPSSTFSVVGKQTPRGSSTSWLNENGSNRRRQEALSSVTRDRSRTLENHDDPRSSSRLRNSISYFPTTGSCMLREENIPVDRSRKECVSNSTFQLYRKSKALIEKATSAWDGWVDRNPSNISNRTEYNSHRYLNQIVENSRTSSDNSFEIRRWKSSMSITEVTDNNWSTVDVRTENKRSNKHSEIPSGNRNSMVAETECGGNYHESIPRETERVAKDDRASSSFTLKSIQPDMDPPDCGILRAVSASACAPQIRVVSVNTEFRTIEKRYTNRAASPIRHSRLTTALPTKTSSSNILFAAEVSKIFVQQVRTDLSREAMKIESLAKVHSADVNKQDAPVNAASKRDFCAQKVDSRPAAKNLSRFPELRRDEEDPTKFERTRYLRLPRTKERITIVPIVLTDGISESPRTADVDFAIPSYAVETAPTLNFQIPSFDAKKCHETSPLLNRDNEGYRRDIANPMCLTEKFAGEKRWGAGKTSVSCIGRHSHAEEDCPPSTTTSNARYSKRPIRITTSNARVVRKAQRYRESSGQKVAKTIPGMRCTPEDFLCET